jgi:hypothetical protein
VRDVAVVLRHVDQHQVAVRHRLGVQLRGGSAGGAGGAGGQQQSA